MKHCGTKKIYTDRLVLRCFTADDAKPLFAGELNSTEVSRFMPRYVPECHEIALTYLECIIEQYKHASTYIWCIQTRRDGRAIGMINVSDSDEKTLSAELSGCIVKDMWNNGIMTEALHAVTEYLFSKTDYNRIYASFDVRNHACERIMQKNGMVFEGISRQSRLDNEGKPTDIGHYSLLRSDWLNCTDSALTDGDEFIHPQGYVNFRAKKLFGMSGKILSGIIAYIDEDGGGPRPEHIHEYGHIYMLIQGGIEINVNNEKIRIRKNETFFVNGTVPHSVRNYFKGLTILVILNVEI